MIINIQKVFTLIALICDFTLLYSQDTITSNNFSGDVIYLDEKNFNKGFITSPFDLIRGRIPGLLVSHADGSPAGDVLINNRGSNSFIGFSTPLILVDGVPILDGIQTINPGNVESITYYKDASAAAIFGDQATYGALFIRTKKGGEKFQASYSGRMAAFSITEKYAMLNAKEFRQIVSTELDDYWQSMLGNADTDWQNEIYRNSFAQDHNLSVSGSPFKIPVRFTFGKLIENGIVETSRLNRTSLNMALDPAFFDNHLKLSIRLNNLNDKIRSADDRVFALAALVDPTQPVKNGSAYGGYYTWLHEGMPSPVLPTNPVALLRQTTISDNNNRLLAFIEADYRLHFLPDLTLSWQFGINQTRADLERRTDSNAAWTNYTPDEKSGNRANISIASVNYNKQLKSINSRLTLNVMHRAEWLKSEFYSILTTLKNSQRHEALIGTINYVLARKYSLTLYLNADGTSLYNDKWGYFPAMSFRWNIGNEKFLSESSIISDLALRLAYRKSGGLNTNAPGEYTVSPWIHHESIKVLNAGIDYSLFNNKISGSVNYYVRNSKDLLVPLEVPYNTVLANFGSIGTRSLDFVVYAKPLNTENLNWQLSLNFAWMQNTVTSMNEFRILTGNIHGGVYSTIQMLYENNKMNSFRVMQQVYGNDETPIEGFYVDRDNSGTINNNDFYSYEQPDPKIAAGFSSDLKYKFWTLSVSGSVWYDNYVYNNISSLSYYENIISSPYYLRNISTGIYDSEFRRQQIYSDYYVENASFLKIEYLQLEYSIPSRKNRPGIGISAGMQNWFTITRYSGLEPEQPDGIEYFMYPRPRAIIFGLKLEV